VPVRSKRLAVGFSGAANTEVVVYTVPAGRTTIVKDVRFANTGSTSVTAYLIAQRPAPPGVILAGPLVLAGAATGGASLWNVLSPGDTLRILCNVTQGVAFWVSGAELDGVAV
jgi:hypothetical protein